MINVLVYGTLRHGMGNNDYFLDRSKPLRTLRISGFVMKDLGAFPAIHEGDGEITVEYFRIDKATLAELDRLEGHPVFYRRIEVVVNELGISAYIYVMSADRIDGRKTISSGDWIEHTTQKERHGR